MSRVASESRVSIAAQIEASRPRAGGRGRNDASQTFDELLPQPEPNPPPVIQKSPQQVRQSANDDVAPQSIGPSEDFETREAVQNEIRPADNKPLSETKSAPPDEKSAPVNPDAAKSDTPKSDAAGSEIAHVDPAPAPATPASAQPAIGPATVPVAAAISPDLHSAPEAGIAAAPSADAGVAAIEAGKAASSVAPKTDAKAAPKTVAKTEVKAEPPTTEGKKAKTAPEAATEAETKTETATKTAAPKADLTSATTSATKTATATNPKTAVAPESAASADPTTDPAAGTEADAGPVRVATAAPVTIMAATAQPLKTIGATIAVQDKPVERTPATAKAAAADAKAQANADAAATTPSTADATATAKPAAAPQPHTADAGTPASRPVDGIVAQPQHLAAALPQGQAPAINPPNLAQATAQVPVPLAGLALEISARAQDGSNRFEIRLDPPELGRIDVSLHVDAHGQVTSHLVVDRADTLNLLQRDSSDLERSLQQAGLKTGDNGLQFSLRDQSFGSAPDNSGRPAARVIVPEIEAPAADIMARSYTRAGQGTGLDIRV